MHLDELAIRLTPRPADSAAAASRARRQGPVLFPRSPQSHPCHTMIASAGNVRTSIVRRSIIREFCNAALLIQHSAEELPPPRYFCVPCLRSRSAAPAHPAHTAVAAPSSPANAVGVDTASARTAENQRPLRRAIERHAHPGPADRCSCSQPHLASTSTTASGRWPKSRRHTPWSSKCFHVAVALAPSGILVPS